MKKGDQTKANMIEVTGALLRRQGYFATGLNEIVSESQVPKGSLYFHFPGGKDELAAIALRNEATMWQARLIGLLEGRPPNLARDAQSICDALATELKASGFANGCPLATVTLETAAQNETLRATVAEHYRSWETFIAARAVAAGVPAAQSERLATFLLSSIEGALILARAYHDTTPLERVAALLKRSFKPKAKKRAPRPQ
jgi:TetR/AcrR family transcriptional repressor of lmrAB and yxaGH operons